MCVDTAVVEALRKKRHGEVYVKPAGAQGQGQSWHVYVCALNANSGTLAPSQQTYWPSGFGISVALENKGGYGYVFVRCARPLDGGRAVATCISRLLCPDSSLNMALSAVTGATLVRSVTN